MKGKRTTTTKPYKSIAGVVFGFRRPDYLAQTLTALEANTEADQLTWYAFLDGAVNPISGNRYAEDEQIEACYRLFCESSLNFEITRNKDNECIALQKQKAHQLYDKHDCMMFFEDDLLTSPHYIRLLRIALEQFPLHSILLYTNSNKGKLDHLKLCNIARIWGYGMSEQLYRRIEDRFTRYATAMSSYDYLTRSSTPGLRRALKEQGVPWHSHDVTVTRLSREFGKGKLFPCMTRAKYIGKFGAIAYRTERMWEKRKMHNQARRYVYPSDKKLKQFHIRG